MLGCQLNQIMAVINEITPHHTTPHFIASMTGSHSMQENETDTERLISPNPPFGTGFPSLTKPERSPPFSQQLSCTQPNKSD